MGERLLLDFRGLHLESKFGTGVGWDSFIAKGSSGVHKETLVVLLKIERAGESRGTV